MFTGLNAVVTPVRELARAVLDAALPQTCVACGAWVPGGSGLACERCHAEITADTRRPYCPRCGRTLPAPAIHADGCARCEAEPFWNVAAVVRVGRYEPALRAVLLGLKYRGRERNAAYLADLLAEELRLQGWVDRLTALIPVPMHWLRRLQRPCDHTGLLTDALARRIRIPVVRLVRRSKHAPSQTRLATKTQRFENVRGCFAPPRWHTPKLAGQTVCIIDNLMVAGATVYEVSKVLRRAGAKRIYAAVLARPAAPGDPRADAPPDISDVAAGT